MSNINSLVYKALIMEFELKLNFSQSVKPNMTQDETNKLLNANRTNYAQMRSGTGTNDKTESEARLEKEMHTLIPGFRRDNAVDQAQVQDFRRDKEANMFSSSSPIQSFSKPSTTTQYT